jgi:thioredoxin 1
MKKVILIFCLFASSLFAFEHLTVDNIDEKLKGKKVILDFYASWCPPCKIIAKNLETYSETKPDEITIYKVDIDDQRDLVGKFGVESIPTLLYIKDGEIKKLSVGLQSLDQINDNVNAYLMK